MIAHVHAPPPLSQAPKQEALRIKCQAKDAKRCGERRHLYVTDRPGAEWQAAIARYLAKRGYQCRYERQVACDMRACKRLHDGIAVYW